MTDLLRQLLRQGVNRKGWRGAGRLSLAAGMLLLLVRCVPAPAPPRPLLDQQALLQRMQGNASAVHSLGGMTRIRTENSAGTNSARQVLFLAKPDRLRAEVLSPFGQPLLLLTVDNGLLSVLLPREQRFLQGAVTAQRLARFIRLPLSAEQMVRLALYDVPLISYDDTVLSRSETGYRLLLQGAEERQQLDFDAAGRLLAATYFHGDEPVATVAYARFDAELGDFPRQVTVTMPGQGASFELAYDDIELNPELAAERFALQPPVGIAVEALP